MRGGSSRGWRERAARGRGWCARSFIPSPPFLFPVSLSACGSGLAAVSGWSAVQDESVSAPRHVLRSLRHVPEPGGLGAPTPGLQQHHPDVQRQHPADQPSQWAGVPRRLGGGGRPDKAAGTAESSRATAKATPEAVLGAPLWIRWAAIRESARPRHPEGPEPQLKLEFLLRSCALKVFWGWDRRPDSPRVGGCVCLLQSSEWVDLMQRSAEFFLSSASLHPLLFDQFGLGVVYRFRLYILLSFLKVSCFQLSRVENACVLVTLIQFFL